MAALIMAATAQAVTCSISTGGLPFIAYSVYAATADTGNATISVTCNYQASDHGTVTVNYTVSLSTGSSNSFVNRTMKIGANSLQYNIYTTNTYNVVWGNGTGGSSTQTGSMSLSNGHKSQTNPLTAYGRIPALQDVSVGNYSDNITVTVTY
ncbi:MAG TPA: spore coat protein U domain-containing protein [Casimicrobiaceae bacterium]|nr:spore coat protein U domain-containing protein [Casimicrobiaceae bacterium]